MIKKRKGLTLVEVMVVIGVIAIIFWGLMKIFSKSTDIWFFSKGQMDMQDKAREAMYWIGQDFRNAKACSMGNLAPNPGFEEPLNADKTPTGWEALNSCVLRLSGGGESIKGGIKSIELLKAPTDYKSDPFLLKSGVNYLTTVWQKTGRNAGIKLLRSSDNSVIISTSTVGENSYWIKLSTGVSLTTDTTSYLKLDYFSTTGFSSPKIIEPLDPGGTKIAIDLANDDKPIVAYYFRNTPTLKDGVKCAWWDGTNWIIRTVEDSAYWPPAVNDAHGWQGLDMALVGGNIPVIVYDYYRATVSPNTQILKYARWNGVGWNIQTIDNGGGTALVGRHCSVAIDSNGMAHVAYMDSTNNDIKYIKQLGPASWAAPVVVDSGGGMKTKIAVDSQNYPYIIYETPSSSNKVKWAHYDGTSWTYEEVDTGINQTGKNDIVIDSIGKSHIIYSSGAGMNYKYARRDTPSNWLIQDLSLFFGSLGQINGYVSSIVLDSNNYPQVCVIATTTTNDIYYFHWTGSTWIGGRTYALQSFPGGEVILDIAIDSKDVAYCAYDKNVSIPAYYHPAIINRADSFFDDVSVSPTEIIFNTASTENIFEYYTAYTTGTPIGKQWKKYRLRYEVKNPPNPAAPGALYRESWVGPNPGDYEKVGILPSGTLCENVKSFKITNQNQETFEVELVLEKEISAGKKKEYRLKNTFTPLVP